MPGTFTTDLALIQAAEATADYTSIGTFKAAAAANNDYKIEGTNCLTFGASSGTGTGHVSVLAIVRAISSAAVNAGGTGYTMGDILTVTGSGTGTQGKLTVSGVSGGVITAVTVPVLTAGSYTVNPTNPVNVSGGTGSAATFNLTIGNLNMTGAGLHVFQWAKEIAWPSTAQKTFGALGLVISSDTAPTAIIPVNMIGLDTILAANAPAATINVAAAGRTFTRTAGSFISDGFVEGKVITVTGFSNPGNNVSGAVILTVTATVITVTTATTSLVDENGNADERIQALPALDSKNGITASGTGYSVTDLLTVTGGTGTAATFTVTAVSTLDTGATQTISVDATLGTFTRSAGDFLAEGFYAGRTIVTSGFTNPGNNTTKTILTVTTTVITVSVLTGLVTETPGTGNERVLSTGGVTAVTITNRGAYTIFPTNTAPTGVATSSGTGTGCTLWLLRVQAVTNSKQWFLGGNDSESIAGWTPYVVDIDGTPDLSLGTPDLTSVDRIGLRSTAIAVGTLAHTVMDVNRYGTGSTIVDGTGRAPVRMIDYQAFDNAANRQLGVVVIQNGIYFVCGKLNFGTTTQTAETVFKDTNLVLVYQDFPVASGFYEILVKGASGQKTTFQLGNYTPASNLTSAGVTIKGAGNISGTVRLDGVQGMAHSNWKLTASDANQVTKLYGCTFSEMLSAALTYNAVSIDLTTNCTTNTTTTLTTTGSFDTSGIVVGMKVAGTNIPSNTYVSSIESATSLTMDKAATGSASSLTMTFTDNNQIRGCTFSNSGTITTNGCVIDNCTFQDIKTGAPISAVYAIIIASSTEGDRITNSKFISCNRAIKITATGTYTFDNLTFSGNAYDIENSSAGLVTINAINGANPGTSINTGGGSTVINNTKTLSVTVVNESTTPIQNAQVYIQKSAVGKSWNYTSDTGNNAGDGDFIVNEVVDSDIPQTGWVHVWDASANDKQNYRYSSWSGKTFTFPTEVTGTANTGGSSTALIRNTGTSFLTADIQEGDTIRNTTDASWAIVDEIVDADNITTAALQGGTDNTWQSGDGYSFHKLAITYIDLEDLVDIPIFNGQTNASGIVTKAYNYTTDLPITVRIRSNQGATKYIPLTTSGTITISGYTATIVLLQDTLAT